jgi:hypothetical protein
MNRVADHQKMSPSLAQQRRAAQPEKTRQPAVTTLLELGS